MTPILTRRGKKRVAVYVGKLPSLIYIILAHTLLLILIISSNYYPVAFRSPPLLWLSPWLPMISLVIWNNAQ